MQQMRHQSVEAINDFVATEPATITVGGAITSCGARHGFIGNVNNHMMQMGSGFFEPPAANNGNFGESRSLTQDGSLNERTASEISF